MWIALLSAALAGGDKIKAKDFVERARLTMQDEITTTPVEVTLKPVRIPRDCVDTDAPKCVAIEITLKNTGESVATIDVNKVTTTWWYEGRQHPLWPVTHTWNGVSQGFAEVVLPPGQSWSEPFTPSNRNQPTQLSIEEAIALRELFVPGYTFQLSVPVTTNGEEHWQSATYVVSMP